MLVGLGWRAAGRAGLEEGGGAWLCFIREIGKSSKFCQPANFASRFLGKICCLFVDILKSRSSQYQQVLPTDSWIKFVAIDLFVARYINQKTANSSIICQPVLGQNLLRLTCSWLYLNQETANGSNSANRFLAKFVAIDLFVDIYIYIFKIRKQPIAAHVANQLSVQSDFRA